MKPFLLKSILPALALAAAVSASAQNGAPQAAAVTPAPASAQTEMQKWLETTDAQWQAAYKREVTDPENAELFKLRQQYRTALEEAIGKVSAVGDLDGALALRGEVKRYEQTSVLPEQDEASIPASVKQVRTAIRAILAREEKETAARAAALLAKYDQALAQAQNELTKSGRLDDALLVKAKRAEVAAAWLTPSLKGSGEKTAAASRGPNSAPVTPSAKIPGLDFDEPSAAAPTAPATGRMLLSRENESHWKKLKGDWKIENGVMTGTGESFIEYPVSVTPPFKLWFTIKVMDGIRAQIFFGPLSISNGPNHSFRIYPGSDAAPMFKYEKNTAYKLAVSVSQKAVEFYADGKLICSAPGFKEHVDKIKFSAGDGWSKGTAEFRDIVLDK